VRVGEGGSGFALACLLSSVLCCDDRKGSGGGFMYLGPWLFLAKGPGAPGRWRRVAPHVWGTGGSFMWSRRTLGALGTTEALRVRRRGRSTRRWSEPATGCCACATTPGPAGPSAKWTSSC
jgi:hypothetical protein